MEMISVRLPEWMVEMINELVEKGIFTTRSEFIREAIRSFLKKYIEEEETLIEDSRYKKLRV